jgi:hypothetical protein
MKSPHSNIRWLVVRNPLREPFYGIGVLHADYRTRQIASVIVSDPEGKTVPSRIINEILGDLEADGKRRWAFDLQFFCKCAPLATLAYAASFGDDPASQATEQHWRERLKEGMLPAVESETSRDEV